MATRKTPRTSINRHTGKYLFPETNNGLVAAPFILNVEGRSSHMANVSVNHFRSANDEPPMENSLTQAYLSRPEFQQGTCDVLVLNAAARQSLMAVRSLGKRGLRIAA